MLTSTFWLGQDNKHNTMCGLASVQETFRSGVQNFVYKLKKANDSTTLVTNKHTNFKENTWPKYVWGPCKDDKISYLLGQLSQFDLFLLQGTKQSAKEWDRDTKAGEHLIILVLTRLRPTIPHDNYSCHTLVSKNWCHLLLLCYSCILDSCNTDQLFIFFDLIISS